MYYTLYCIFGVWLPLSRRMKLAKRIRVFFAKLIVEYCGNNVNIEKGAYFTPQLKIGDRSGIGVNCEAHGYITIGKDVMMGPDCIIYSSNHCHDRTDIPMIDQGGEYAKPVTIGNDVWLGRRVMIMPGVNIGDGCIIGAGAVVCHDIPPYSIAVGVPARVVRNRKTNN